MSLGKKQKISAIKKKLAKIRALSRDFTLEHEMSAATRLWDELTQLADEVKMSGVGGETVGAAWMEGVKEAKQRENGGNQP